MIYLDYVSTTPLNQEVNHMYQSLLNDYFANADSLYSLGLKTSALMEKSRELTAQMLKVLPEEIIFTSGASESNSTAIKGCAFQYQNRGKHIITTAVEHSSVYQSCIQLRDVFGFEVDFISVNQNGEFNLKELEEKIAFARQFYNDTVMKYNEYLQRFPSNIIANIFKYKERPYFEMNEAEKAVPKVQF